MDDKEIKDRISKSVDVAIESFGYRKVFKDGFKVGYAPNSYEGIVPSGEVATHHFLSVYTFLLATYLAQFPESESITESQRFCNGICALIQNVTKDEIEGLK